MNDFTKEELQYMAEAIDMWFKGCDGELPEKIYLKLQSMIDNYKKPCNHNWMNLEYEYLQCQYCFARKGFNE